MFFVLSKIMSPFLAVENWFIFGLAILLILMARQRWQSARIMTMIMLAVGLVIGFLPIGDPLLRHLEMQYSKPEKISDVEGIILLGGPENRDLSNEWQEPQFGDAGERITETLKLAREFPNAKILITSGVASLHGQNKPGATGGEILATILTEQGMASERLIIEQQARNTADNAQLAKLALGEEVSGNWVLVTSAFHMQRAMRSFENAGWANLIPWPTDYRTLPFLPNIRWNLMRHIETLDLAIHEYVGVFVYRITGR